MARIYKDEFHKLLNQISSLSLKEKDYLHKTFEPSMNDGLDAWELKQKISSLKFNQAYKYGEQGHLEANELEEVKRKLLDHLT